MQLKKTGVCMDQFENPCLIPLSYYNGDDGFVGFSMIETVSTQTSQDSKGLKTNCYSILISIIFIIEV